MYKKKVLEYVEINIKQEKFWKVNYLGTIRYHELTKFNLTVKCYRNLKKNQIPR